ncbi:hypothetical protein [Mycobacterium parmense]|uniref:hypothetical protein n=1 Tax=Mycobacterium parmense TaxID=185642 RepID=UPI00111BF31B|nr:hypothetical protein [Mycobacterium parmense]MCV7351129.1 hypothetical protein [Mycobacterium parmense]
MVNEPPNPSYAPPPYLLFAQNHIYAQSGSGNLLVWDTSNWTSALYGSDGLNPQGFAAYGDLVYFNGSWLPGLEGPVQDLFSTNGAELSQITNTGLNPCSLAVAFGKLFFSGYNGSNNVLYAYDGSTVEQVGVDVVNPQYLTVSVAGPEFATEFPPPTHLVPGPRLFMSGQDFDGGPTWLYRYDGSTLTKIAPTTADHSDGLQPYNLAGLVWIGETEIGATEAAPWQSALFFSGVNANTKTGLWMFDGTTAREITTPAPSGGDHNSSVYPFNITGFEGKGTLYFTAYDIYIGSSPSQRGLFMYDPVENHVSEIIKSSTAKLDPQFNTDWENPPFFNQTTMTVFNNDLYFSAKAGSGAESVPNLWRANLNSQGDAANPGHVYVEGDPGLQPFSLTTADL